MSEREEFIASIDAAAEVAAFPCAIARPGGISYVVGMTLRDYFAAAAMQALGAADHATAVQSPENMARYAYAFADAMLAERARGDKTGEATQNELRG